MSDSSSTPSSSEAKATTITLVPDSEIEEHTKSFLVGELAGTQIEAARQAAANNPDIKFEDLLIRTIYHLTEQLGNAHGQSRAFMAEVEKLRGKVVVLEGTIAQLQSPGEQPDVKQPPAAVNGSAIDVNVHDGCDHDHLH